MFPRLPSRQARPAHAEGESRSHPFGSDSGVGSRYFGSEGAGERWDRLALDSMRQKSADDLSPRIRDHFAQSGSVFSALPASDKSRALCRASVVEAFQRLHIQRPASPSVHVLELARTVFGTSCQARRQIRRTPRQLSIKVVPRLCDTALPDRIAARCPPKNVMYSWPAAFTGNLLRGLICWLRPEFLPRVQIDSKSQQRIDFGFKMLLDSWCP